MLFRSWCGMTGAASLGTELRAAGLDWIVPDWPAPANIRAFVTTRTGGVSTGPYATMNLGRRGADDATARAENLRRFEAFLPGKPAWLDQAHGVAVATLTRNGCTTPRPIAGADVVRKDVDGCIAPRPIADAAVTCERDVVCALLTADCLPVFFADGEGTAVGAAHAGWRGLAAGVLEATILALANLDVPPDRLMAWLGPAIGPESFEVGDDVRDAFCATDPGAATCFVRKSPGKWHADLYDLARQRLLRSGVTLISGGGFCTFTDSARFFSYRRERESGRMAAAVWLAQS